MKEEQSLPPWWVVRPFFVPDRIRRCYPSSSILDAEDPSFLARKRNPDDVSDECGL